MVRELEGTGFETRLVQTGVTFVGLDAIRVGGSSLNKEWGAGIVVKEAE